MEQVKNSLVDFLEIWFQLAWQVGSPQRCGQVRAELLADFAEREQAPIGRLASPCERLLSTTLRTPCRKLRPESKNNHTLK